MFSCGATNFDLGAGTYKVSVADRAFLTTFTGVNNIVVNGSGAVISDARTYAGDLSGIFKFVGCSNVQVSANYLGQTRPVSGSGLEDTGAVFVGLYNACNRARVSGSIKEARYGVHSGSYHDDADFRGGCTDIEVDIHAENTGYPVAFYLANAVDLKVDCDTVGRAVYLAGTNAGSADVRFANIYSPVAVIITDAKDSSGAVHGSNNLRISSTDTGSTYTSLDSWAAGISGSWSDPSVRYEDIDIHVNVRASNGVSTSMGGVIVNNIPGWNPSNVVRNLRISGTVDRSLQTAGASNAVGDIYIYANDTTAPIMDNINIENFSIKKGTVGFSAAWPVFLSTQGLVGNINVVNCDFSQARLLFDPGTAAAQVAGAGLRLVNTSLLELGNPGYSPTVSLINSTLLTAASGGIEGARDVANSSLTGSSKQARVKTMDVALSGPSVVLTAAIPGGYLDGVCGIITSAITGSTGYMVGTAAQPALFVETLNNAVGAAFSPVNSNPAFTGAVFSAVATDLVITNRTGAFSGGSVRLFIHYTVITPPTL